MTSGTFLLDTNAISHAVRHPEGPVAQRISRQEPTVLTSVIVEAELRFGIARKPTSRIAERIALFLKDIEVLPFDSIAAEHYGDIRAQLSALGEQVGAMDTLIAGHARSREMCVVTHNVAHFQRIPNLAWENWQDWEN